MAAIGCLERQITAAHETRPRGVLPGGMSARMHEDQIEGVVDLLVGVRIKSLPSAICMPRTSRWTFKPFRNG